MRVIRPRASVPFLAVLLLLVTGGSSVADPSRDIVDERLQAGIDRLQASAAGGARVEVSDATGAVRLVVLPPDKGAPATPADPERLAIDFFTRHGAAFGITDPASELRHLDTRTDRLGYRHVAYEQIYRGLPVFGTRLKAHVNADGQLSVANGSFIPGLTLDPEPRVDAARATAIAARDTAERLDIKRPPAKTPRLLVFRENLVRGVPGANRLAWEVEVGDGAAVREFVYVDAHKGDVIDRIAGIHESIDRRIYNGGFSIQFLVWEEGDIEPFGQTDIDNLINYTADSYNVFSTVSDATFLSWDGVDGTMHTVNNDPGINCPNANWNGVSTNYCAGVTADDTVAHEWAHAYTSSTHGLIYQWQPGALNESYSDIWGEIVDMLNGSGTDSPVPIRGDGCSVFGGSPPPSFKVNSPSSISDFYGAAGASFNPSSSTLVTGIVRLVNDGDDEGGDGSATDGCQSLTGFTPGSIALVDRGACSFVTKTINAQAAGASAVIIVNNVDNSVFSMSGSGGGITIPSIMIGLDDGDLIKTHVGAGVGATIALSASSESSYRWLSGEDDPAFGGAIRDMWNPNCYGDPGRVNDSMYWCSEGDNGGVHSNSGVPNHAFALLIDGGTYNGQTIAPIGMTRAAAIYWRAQSVYQVPTTDFEEHADMLERSCDDLIGAQLYMPITEEPDPVTAVETITQADCDEVAKTMLAVEMREKPDRCSFVPMLERGSPAVCESGSSIPVFSTDWESGMDGWVAGTRNVANPSTFDTPDWAVVSPLPDEREGAAAFVANLVIGNCRDDLETGVLLLESPDVTIPSGVEEPRLTFDHWAATELYWDGANVKISVNGGPWAIVPPEAFLFNAYNETLNGPATGNTNPLGGEPAFSGADGGSLVGGWGQSQVDLTGIAGRGDTVRLRFELGQDGCNGRVGWYVDDVSLVACSCTSGEEPLEWFADVDGDGFGAADTTQVGCTQPAGYVAEAGDCNDADGGAWSAPGSAEGLNFDVDRQTIRWSAPAAGGTAFVSDLLRSGTPSDFGETAICAVADGAELLAVDADVPAPGAIWYYLVRVENSCASGSLGADSAGGERAGRSCP